jgi:hypothetical protein
VKSPSLPASLPARSLTFHLSSAASREGNGRDRFNFGIPTGAAVNHHRRRHQVFGMSSKMLQRSTQYPVKMAAVVICQLSLLALLVWMSL